EITEKIRAAEKTGLLTTTWKTWWTPKLCCCPFLTGVPASHALAEEDADRMKNFKNSIFNVAKNKGIDPAVIAAIISRETRAGNVLPSSGWNEGGVAFGIMQVVARCNSPKGGKDSEEHITQAAGILIDFINSMNKSWPPALQYKGGIAAYNCGPGAVTSQDMDQNTEGGDYANDVVARAQWYKHHGY
uniref:Lysozyme g n=1 Tax=Pygocentrus nattereri TaxID=42514 RepID=A0A3B4BPJ2_PYGNA